MAWRKNDPSLGNDPSYLEPRITKNEKDIKDLQQEEKVSSVNGQTGNVQLPIPSKTSELTNDNGFITINNVTKTQIGLGNVQNYEVATQLEAETGTSASKYMTPQRTKQAIDKIVTPLNETVTKHLEDYELLKGKVLTSTINTINYYVSPGGNDVTGDGTQTKPFKTIQFAINKTPLFLKHGVTINLAPGTYDEDIFYHGFSGLRTLVIKGGNNLTDAANYIIKSIAGVMCTTSVSVEGVTIKGDTKEAFNVQQCINSRLVSCIIDQSSANYGVVASYSKIYIGACRISNRGRAIMAGHVSEIVSDSNTGSNNTFALYANYGGKIAKAGGQPTGTTAEFKQYGGDIL